MTGCGLGELWTHLGLEDPLVEDRLWVELRCREELQFFLLSGSPADKAAGQRSVCEPAPLGPEG